MAEELLELLGLLDAHQVGQVLGRHPESVLHAVRRGELKAVRLGHRTIRFRPEDVRAYIDAHLAEAVAP